MSTPRIARYDFTITGRMEVDRDDFEAMERLIRVRKAIFATIIPILRKEGLTGVFLSDRRVKEDPAAIAMAEHAAQQNACEEGKGRQGMQEGLESSGSPAGADSGGGAHT